MNDTEQKLFELMFKHHKLFLRLEVEDIQDYLMGEAEIIGEHQSNSWLVWRDEEYQFHRDCDRPAVIWTNGTKFWYRRGHLHRDHDQPALVSPLGAHEWWVNGKKVR